MENIRNNVKFLIENLALRTSIANIGMCAFCFEYLMQYNNIITNFEVRKKLGSLATKHLEGNISQASSHWDSGSKFTRMHQKVWTLWICHLSTWETTLLPSTTTHKINTVKMLSNLRHLVCVWQPFKTDKPVFFAKMSCAHQTSFFKEKISSIPRLGLKTLQ